MGIPFTPVPSSVRKIGGNTKNQVFAIVENQTSSNSPLSGGEPDSGSSLVKGRLGGVCFNLRA